MSMKRGVIAQLWMLLLIVVFLICFIPVLGSLVSAFSTNFQDYASVNFVATMLPFTFAIIGIGVGLSFVYAGLRGGQ